MRTLLVFGFITAMTLATAAISVGGAVSVAFIVNKTNPADTLPAKQLKQIFNGEKARWPNGEKIHTMATGAATPEHKVAIPFLFGMDEAEYQKYCIHANFVGTPQQFPADFGSSQQVLNFVSSLPGGIGFIRADAVTAAVKILKIDGKGPGDPGYALNAQ